MSCRTNGDSLKTLKAQFGNRIKVSPEEQFVGFAVYQKVIDSGVDVVLLASRPGFVRRISNMRSRSFCDGCHGVRLSCNRWQRQRRSSCLSWRVLLEVRQYQKNYLLDDRIGEVQALNTTYNTDRSAKSNPLKMQNAGRMDDALVVFLHMIVRRSHCGTGLSFIDKMS